MNETVTIIEHQPHAVIACRDGHLHAIAFATLRQWGAGALPAENLPVCLLRAIVAEWTLLVAPARRDDSAAWVRLADLPPGLVFATQTGALAVKTQYHHLGGQCKCVLLGSGEYAAFADGDNTLVVAIELAGASHVTE